MYIAQTMLCMPGQSGNPVVFCCNSQGARGVGQWQPDTRMRPLLSERGEQLQQVCWGPGSILLVGHTSWTLPEHDGAG